MKESEKHGVKHEELTLDGELDLKLENLTKMETAKVLIASLLSEEYVHNRTL